jgi:hypothetical protein
MEQRPIPKMKAISFYEFTGSRTATLGKDMFCSDSKMRLKDKNITQRVSDLIIRKGEE